MVMSIEAAVILMVAVSLLLCGGYCIKVSWHIKTLEGASFVYIIEVRKVSNLLFLNGILVVIIGLTTMVYGILRM